MTLPECTCAEDDWLGARGHTNLTLNGHWLLTDADKHYFCPQCEGFLPRSYADPTKAPLDGKPLYETPDEWWAALDAGIGYHLTPDQVKAAAQTERQRLKDQAKADAQQLAINKARGLA